MENTVIKVTGRGRIKLPPDVAIFSISLNGTSDDYASAIATASERASALNAVLVAHCFEKGVAKTTGVNVSPRYDYPNGERRFAGFGYAHDLTMTLPSDNATLSRALTALSRTEATFSFSYGLSDPERAREKLLADAVRDARSKAEALAGAAGVVLGDMIAIEHSAPDAAFRGRTFASACNAEGGTVRAEFDPDDVSATDEVTISWSIARRVRK